MHKKFSDENLIAYLLGDASAELRESIERDLPTDEELCEQLTFLRQMLGHMDSMAAVFEPPGDLVESTLQRIDALEAAPQPLERAHAPAVSLSRGLSDVQPGRSESSRMDSMVLCLSLATLCCLFLPTILGARNQSRKYQCASHLRGIGQSLQSFAVNDPSGRYPRVGDDELTNFAGVYTVHLQSAGYYIPYSHVHCPSLIGHPQAVPAVLESIPNLYELGQMTYVELAEMKRVLGGNYAYSLGVMEQDRAVAPRLEGRSNFAILSDAPVFIAEREEYIAHEGRGLNILYEDGRVDYVNVPILESNLPAASHPQLPVRGSKLDHPFRNDHGLHAVGLNVLDASLAPSGFSPQPTRQR